MSHDQRISTTREAIALSEQFINAAPVILEQRGQSDNPEMLANVAEVKRIAARLADRLGRYDQLIADYADLKAMIEAIDVNAIKAGKDAEQAEIAAIRDGLAKGTKHLEEIRQEEEDLDRPVTDRIGAAMQWLKGNKALARSRAEMDAERNDLLKIIMPGFREKLKDLEEDSRYLGDEFQPIFIAANDLVPTMLKRAQHNLPSAYADAHALGWSLGSEALKGLSTKLGAHVAALTQDGVFDFQSRFEASGPAVALVRAILPAMEAAGHYQILRTWAPHPELRPNLQFVLPAA